MLIEVRTCLVKKQELILFCLLNNDTCFSSGLCKSVFYYQAFLLKNLPLFMSHLNSNVFILFSYYMKLKGRLLLFVKLATYYSVLLLGFSQLLLCLL